ncbi:MAG: prepilin-type N-terminal cleavage/methylation domain-containing protein [Desulfobacterales bacterium]|jgi:general secretion pathway protein J
MHKKLQKISVTPLPGTTLPAFDIRQSDSGFTLLEILIAIFIFAIIVTTIFGSYNSVFTGAEVINQGVISYETARTCMNRMILDLESIHVSLTPQYAPPDFNGPPDPYRIVGDIHNVQTVSFPKLRFTSTAHVSFRGKTESNIAEIVYYVQATDNGHYLLRRADNLYPYEEFEENSNDPVLCENLKSLTFTYYDREGAEYDLWDSDAEDFGYATPAAIGISLELTSGTDSLWFKTMVTLPVYRKKQT